MSEASAPQGGPEEPRSPEKPRATGGKNSYYLVQVDHPRRRGKDPYEAECEDIISALGMTFDEGCEFKAIWRTAAARLGVEKPGHDPVYDAEKRVHYASESLATERIKALARTEPGART